MSAIQCATKIKMKITVRFELADVQKKHDSFTGWTIKFMKNFVNEVYSRSILTTRAPTFAGLYAIKKPSQRSLWWWPQVWLAM